MRCSKGRVPNRKEMDMTKDKENTEPKKYAKPLGLAPHEFLARGNEFVKKMGATHPYPIDLDTMLRNAGITNDKNSDYLPLVVDGHLWVEKSKDGQKRYFLVLDEEAFVKATESKSVSVYEHCFRLPK